MQLEQSVLLMEFFFFLLVDLSDLFEDLATVLAHFQFNFFLSLVETDVFGILTLQIFGGPFFMKVATQDFIVFLF